MLNLANTTSPPLRALVLPPSDLPPLFLRGGNWFYLGVLVEQHKVCGVSALGIHRTAKRGHLPVPERTPRPNSSPSLAATHGPFAWLTNGV
ncbi:hypothetical protein EIP91_007173 [Steccherinum ochraceum]|uniref:Uncharacterized protein n=1 Tax=Steccherinum ochraceum TaxID=92696 RepID=A0A4R0RUU4_9APHY|nr:hypothetical protein EIP91_007173 [Steccherinum ochraceum]